MILLIDNYDSFTYNLYQYIGELERDIKVVRNDRITVSGISELLPGRIVLSPGPGAPKDAGVCMDVVRSFYDKVPILGICLGHQCIGEAFGGVVSYAESLCHGKSSIVKHDGTGIFKGIKNPVTVARYHSLAVQRDSLPDCLRITSETDDGEIMGIAHKSYPVFGLQFHPESIITECGMDMIRNFLEI